MSDVRPFNRDQRQRGRRMLIGIAAVFFVPLFAAWIWFANIDDWRPAGSTNNGELIEPVRTLANPQLRTLQGDTLGGEALERTWTLVLVADGVCDEICERNLYHTRQVRIALGKDMQRVKRLLLIAGGDTLEMSAAVDSEHPDLMIAMSDDVVAQIVSATAQMPPREDAIYLIDPLLNVMMRFAPDLDPRLMVKDLKRLLKVSRIG